jgi:hypothetical protein
MGDLMLKYLLAATLFIAVSGQAAIHPMQMRPRTDYVLKFANFLDRMYGKYVEKTFEHVHGFIDNLDNQFTQDCKDYNCRCPKGKWIGVGGVYESYLDIGYASAGGLVITGTMSCLSDSEVATAFVALCAIENVKTKKETKFNQSLGIAEMHCHGYQNAEDMNGGSKGVFANVEVGPVGSTVWREGDALQGCYGMIQTLGAHGFKAEVGMVQCTTFNRLNTIGKSPKSFYKPFVHH